MSKIKEQEIAAVSKVSKFFIGIGLNFIREVLWKTKGFEHLLKKIEQMSQEKKNELEFFLQSIIEGRLDIKELLKFEFDKEEANENQGISD